ncbi:hypothetical protein RchiOBHm_Chr2g0151061 [Rosa chinensis]|uniref:Uncharacterized protein n=1 Tax=Rosa chinensis TaxID=74649 RepID=A0A2P6S012_ROSCH|nr:hypothetical protein RchiOBHm_Chr2g0151061 [Rosa chinensis]
MTRSTELITTPMKVPKSPYKEVTSILLADGVASEKIQKNF